MSAKIHFIGAGPGAPDLITVRGLRLIERCPVCLYAGSLVPQAVVAAAPAGARVIDTAPLTLDEIVAEMESAHAAGLDVARVHSGDISLYGAVAEQMRRLDALGIPYDLTPGVPAFAAAASALGIELTLPEVTQTVILTRTAVRSSPMPPGEDARHARPKRGHARDPSLDQQSGRHRAHASAALRRGMPRGDRSPRKLARRAHPARHARRPSGAPSRQARITRTALILVGRVLGAARFSESRLYAPDHHHVLRPRR